MNKLKERKRLIKRRINIVIRIIVLKFRKYTLKAIKSYNYCPIDWQIIAENA